MRIQIHFAVYLKLIEHHNIVNQLYYNTVFLSCPAFNDCFSTYKLCDLGQSLNLDSILVK